MAEFCQPRMALKIPQPPPPPISGLQHCFGTWSDGYHNRVRELGKRMTHVDVPHALADVVRAWTRSNLGGVTTNNLVPLDAVNIEKAGSNKRSDIQHEY